MDEQQNTTPEVENQIPQYTPEAPESEPKAFGPLIGILIIVAILAFGGFYFWGASLQDKAIEYIPEMQDGTSFEVLDTTIEEYTMTDAEFDALFNESADAAGDTAEAVLDATLDDLSDLDALDAELEALESEL